MSQITKTVTLNIELTLEEIKKLIKGEYVVENVLAKHFAHQLEQPFINGCCDTVPQIVIKIHHSAEKDLAFLKNYLLNKEENEDKQT